jgi:DNA-binding MarR family transcriptional regulator
MKVVICGSIESEANVANAETTSARDRETLRLARIAGITHEEMSRAFDALGRLQNLYVDLRMEHWERFGLTTGQLRLMLAVNRAADRSLTVGEIAATLHVATPTITKMVDRLVRRDMVRRLADPDDRRVSRIALTPLGADMLEGVSAPGRLRIARLFAAMERQHAPDFITLFEEFLSAAEDVLQNSSNQRPTSK